jgi:hypothetical protein
VALATAPFDAPRLCSDGGIIRLGLRRQTLSQIDRPSPEVNLRESITVEFA